MAAKAAFRFAGLFPKDETGLWRAFDDLFQDLPGFTPDGWSIKGFPSSDVIYERDKTIVELPLAGYSKGQLKVELLEGCLVISATKCEGKDRSRRAMRAFRRTFWIGNEHEVENISASFIDGLLRVEIPCVKEKILESKQIEIR